MIRIAALVYVPVASGLELTTQLGEPGRAPLWDTTSPTTLSFRAQTHWVNFCLFFEKELSPVPWDKCGRWFFRSNKFCRGLPNFSEAVLLPWSRTNFCQAWNLTDLLIYTLWFEGKCKWRKFNLFFLVGVFQSEVRQNYFILIARQSNVEDGRFTPRYATWRSLLRLQLLRLSLRSGKKKIEWKNKQTN